MKKIMKIILCQLVVFTVILCFSNLCISQEIQSNIIFVGGSGQGNYNTIQSAIDNATSEDIIFVFNGFYPEAINVNKSLTITGEDKNNTFIGSSIVISSDFVKINGFTIKNSLTSGIEILSNSNIIQDNIFSNNTNGIYINGSNYNLIYHNSFFNNNLNAYDNGDNSWYNIELMQGNFWDDYNELDKNNDGIGDKPYFISGGNNQDKYPLMMPYSGIIRYKEFYVDYPSIFNMLIIGMIIIIIFLLPIAYLLYKKERR